MPRRKGLEDIFLAYPHELHFFHLEILQVPAEDKSKMRLIVHSSLVMILRKLTFFSSVFFRAARRSFCQSAQTQSVQLDKAFSVPLVIGAAFFKGD